MHGINIFPHLDSRWLWRWHIVDEHGDVVATSPRAHMFLAQVRAEIEVVRASFART